MGSLLATLFSSDFAPHGHCYLWTWPLVVLHALSDTLIGLAYLAIPLTLWYIVRRRTDLPFNWMMLCFATFIIACGATHWFEVWTIWNAHYWLSGTVKAVTAVASVGTAVLLVRLVPAILAIPSHAQMEEAYAAVRASEEKLRDLNTQLEERVAERTRELESAHAERTELQAQLHQSQKMEAIGRLAGGIAHDVNNMLTVITGYTEVMLEQIPPGEARVAAEEVQTAVDRTAHLTAQLLAFSRKQVRQPVMLEVDEVVKRASRMLGRLVGEDIRIELGLEADGWLVLADGSQVEQVLMNLVVNARDAMPRGGLLSIRTARETHDTGEFVRLSVRDQGTGIDAAVLPHIFEPFFTTKPPGSGTGLGLATAHGIVEQSGGFITVDSTPGRGTTFHVHLPRAEASAQPAPVAPVVPAAAPTPRATGSATVLVVDDEAGVRRVAVMSLRRAGFTVLEAGSLSAALDLAATHDAPIDLLISDVVMPGGYGPDLYEKLKKRRAGLRVLFMSGHTDQRLSGHGVLEPGVALLAKPFTPAELCRRVSELVGADAALAYTPPS